MNEAQKKFLAFMKPTRTDKFVFLFIIISLIAYMFFSAEAAKKVAAQKEWQEKYGKAYAAEQARQKARPKKVIAIDVSGYDISAPASSVDMIKTQQVGAKEPPAAKPQPKPAPKPKSSQG